MKSRCCGSKTPWAKKHKAAGADDKEHQSADHAEYAGEQPERLVELVDALGQAPNISDQVAGAASQESSDTKTITKLLSKTPLAVTKPLSNKNIDDLFYHYLSHQKDPELFDEKEKKALGQLFFIFQQQLLLNANSTKSVQGGSSISTLTNVSSKLPQYENNFSRHSPTLVPIFVKKDVSNTAKPGRKPMKQLLTKIANMDLDKKSHFLFPVFASMSYGNLNEAWAFEYFNENVLKPGLETLRGCSSFRGLRYRPSYRFVFGPAKEFSATPDGSFYDRNARGNEKPIAVVEAKSPNIDIKEGFLEFQRIFRDTETLGIRGLSVKALEFVSIINQSLHQMLATRTNVALITNHNSTMVIKANLAHLKQRLLESDRAVIDMTGRVYTDVVIDNVFAIDADDGDAGYAQNICGALLEAFQITDIDAEVDFDKTRIKKKTQDELVDLLVKMDKAHVCDVLRQKKAFFETIVCEKFLGLAGSDELLDMEYYGLLEIISNDPKENIDKLTMTNAVDTSLSFQRLQTSSFGDVVPKIISGKQPWTRWSTVLQVDNHVLKCYDPFLMVESKYIIRNDAIRKAGLSFLFFQYEVATYKQLLLCKVDCIPNVVSFGYLDSGDVFNQLLSKVEAVSAAAAAETRKQTNLGGKSSAGSVGTFDTSGAIGTGSTGTKDRAGGDTHEREKLQQLFILENKPVAEIPFNALYIQMEHIRPARRKMPFIDIAKSALVGLCRIHCAGVSHRDINRSNVLLGHRGDEPDKVFFLDFGLSKVYGNGRGKGAKPLLDDLLNPVNSDNKKNQADFAEDYKKLEKIYPGIKFLRKQIDIEIESLVNNEIENCNYWHILQAQLTPLVS